VACRRSGSGGREEGLVLAKVRSNEEFRRELQYTEVLSKMPLITVEKIAESEPVPSNRAGKCR